MSDEKYYTDLCNLCRQDIGEYESELSRTLPTDREIEEALEHHLQQLQKNGATLEDNVCQVLRKLLKASEIRQKIERREKDLREYQGELWNVTGA